MNSSKYLAVDFGAESGRTILGSIADNKIELQEINRFKTKQYEKAGHFRWDMAYLFGELQNGIRLTAQQGHNNLAGIAVDTWGVDFGLLDKKGQLLEDPVIYRDARTEGMVENVFELLTFEQMYDLTGIQLMQINTVFQLRSLVVNRKSLLSDSDTLLFIPDLFNFLMTGEKVSEYTISSTSQLLDARTREWANELFTNLDIPLDIMAPVLQPGTSIGRLDRKLAADAGLEQVEVIAAGSHDTASAVAAVPAVGRNWAYLSSGTWSLLGVELDEPIISVQSRQNNFTNEGGVDGKIRFLKNAMGLWLVQRCQKDWARQERVLDYAELVELAKRAPEFKCVLNPDHQSFLNPADMPEAIETFCRTTGQKVPGSKGEFVRIILESLAFRYRSIVDSINSMRPEPIEVLHIVGGGCQNELLNQFTANAVGIPVIAGPVEATSLGNIIVQAITKRDLPDLVAGRELVRNSFPLKQFEPQYVDTWQEMYDKSKSILNVK
jgi:rhamnulokinase